MIGRLLQAALGRLTAPLLGYAILAVALAWSASLGALWVHMDAKIGAAREAGQLEARAKCAEDRAAALATAVDEWGARQSAIMKQARKDAAEIAADLARASTTIQAASKELSAYDRSHPLPVGCRADAVRMRHVNAGR